MAAFHPRSVLAELKELPALLLTKEVQAALALCGAYFEQVHISDTIHGAWNVPQGATRIVRLVFRLPKESATPQPQRVDVLADFLRLALHLTDRVARAKLGPALRERLKEGRAREEAIRQRQGHQRRQELAQQRKAEKLAALKDRAPLANREAQRKREEKEARQLAKARGPKARVKLA